MRFPVICESITIAAEIDVAISIDGEGSSPIFAYSLHCSVQFRTAGTRLFGR